MFIVYGDVCNFLKEKRNASYEDSFCFFEDLQDKGLYENVNNLEEILNITLIEYDKINKK